MSTDNYAIQVKLGDVSFDSAIERVTSALHEEGFGVLTEIDVKKTLDAKLGVPFRPYRILGACNPKLAHQALQHDARIGVLLPCNVVVQQVESGVEVLIVDPISMFGVVKRASVEPIAAEVGEKLKRVAASLRSAVA